MIMGGGFGGFNALTNFGNSIDCFGGGGGMFNNNMAVIDSLIGCLSNIIHSVLGS